MDQSIACYTSIECPALALHLHHRQLVLNSLIMAAIQSLLNPLPESKTECPTPPTPSVPRYLPSPSSTYRATPRPRTPSPPGARKKQKLCKDQAIFTRGAIRGECRYPPFEFQDELLEAQHQQFELHPMGQIADFARHIPYNSEKKLFESRTGRQWFEGRHMSAIVAVRLIRV